MDYRGRQKRALEAAEQRGAGTLLVTHMPNVRYLCGFTGSAGVLVLSRSGQVFFTDGRYMEQARAEVEGARVVIAKGAALAEAATWMQANLLRGGSSIVRLAIESEHVTVLARRALRTAVGTRIRVVDTAGLAEGLRGVKEEEEVRKLRAAVKLGSELFGVAEKAIRPGVRETEVAAELEYAARRRGAQGMSFETIVAAGGRSARPHGVASAQRIPRKGFIVLDFGVILAGYCSDMTRTVHVGKPGAEARRMYDAVRRAQESAIKAVRAGVEAGAVDEAARSVLKKTGYGKFFTHSTGHGVGLEIHELPRIARGQREKLEDGMVITIEPGIYVPGRGGVRIEDMVVVRRDGCEILTPTTKELIAL